MRDDAIMATGRSDYPNQVNNVLGFPYIFRGALDVRATTINMEMKIAAAHALAELAREDVPDEVAAAYRARGRNSGPDYIIPVPFDPRLISHVPPAVAKAAMDTGVARKPIDDMDAYRQSLRRGAIRSPACCSRCSSGCGASPKRVVFAEGEEEQVIRAAATFVQQGLGTALLVGREEPIRQSAKNRRHRARQGHRDHQRRAVDAQRQLCRLSLRAAAAQGLPVPRRAAADQPGPQPFRRLHGGARRRRSTYTDVDRVKREYFANGSAFDGLVTFGVNLRGLSQSDEPTYHADMKAAMDREPARSRSTPGNRAPNTLDAEDYEKRGWLGPNLLICHYIPASDVRRRGDGRAPKRRSPSPRCRSSGSAAPAIRASRCCACARPAC